MTTLSYFGKTIENLVFVKKLENGSDVYKKNGQWYVVPSSPTPNASVQVTG